MFPKLEPLEPGQRLMGHHQEPLRWQTGTTHSPRTAFVKLPPARGPLMGHLGPRRASSVVAVERPDRSIRREEQPS